MTTPTTTPATIDFGPLLALRAEVEEFTHRVGATVRPDVRAYRSLSNRLDVAESTVKAQLLALVGDPGEYRITADDSAGELASLISGGLAFDAFGDRIYGDERFEVPA
jgi:hypothetical protein